MSEESLKHFYDALDAARAILRFAQDKTFKNYCTDELLSSAVERKFEIIGEALNRETSPGNHPNNLTDEKIRLHQ